MWLNAGRIKDIGDTDVVTRYMAAMVEKDNVYLTAAHRKAQRRGARAVHGA
jgi:hypothetical protein